jgi:hypothetical protein
MFIVCVTKSVRACVGCRGRHGQGQTTAAEAEFSQDFDTGIAAGFHLVAFF